MAAIIRQVALKFKSPLWAPGFGHCPFEKPHGKMGGCGVGFAGPTHPPISIGCDLLIKKKAGEWEGNLTRFWG